MKVVLLLALCLACATASRLTRRRLDMLERELEEREVKEKLIEEEIARDRKGYEEEMFREFKERALEVEHKKTVHKRQQIEGCIQGDVIFILDSSGSIGVTNWQYVLQFVSDVIDRMGIGPQATRAGLVTFGNRAHVIFQLANYSNPEDMKVAINGTKFLDENTNTSGGIYVAMHQMFTAENGDRPMAPNMAVIITDGVSTYDNDKTIPYAEEARNKGIMVISLGVGDKTSQDELEGMASTGRDGNKLVYQVGGYEMLNLVKEKLAHVACDVPEEDETPDPACEQKDVECAGLPCKLKCKYGFAPDKNLCLTCQCMSAPPECKETVTISP